MRECPFEKETSFGREKGYTTCTNPRKRTRYCSHAACERAECEAAAEKSARRPPEKDLIGELGIW